MPLTWTVAETAERLAADPEGADLRAVCEFEDGQVAVDGAHGHHRVQRVDGARHRLAGQLQPEIRTHVYMSRKIRKFRTDKFDT